MSAARDAIERDVWIEAPIERVWFLVSESGPLGRWFADAGATIDLRPGGALELRWSHGAVVRGRVEAVVPPRRLAFSWAPFRAPGGSEPRPGNSTHVEISLTPEGAGTRVTVLERGFDGLDATSAERIANRAGNVEGWELELRELADLAALEPA